MIPKSQTLNLNREGQHTAVDTSATLGTGFGVRSAFPTWMLSVRLAGTGQTVLKKVLGSRE